MDERMKKIRRYMTRCTAVILIFVMTLLTACGNAQVNSAETAESAEMTENVESCDESIKNEAVDIIYDKAESEEEIAVNDSEIVDDHYDTNLSTAEVFELFLNSGLTVELEEEQVTIDKLFWGNDIKYCFGDIDGDGSEELHIKDDVVYYAIKAEDGILQIIFEGWWFYEPVGTDGACGILYYPHEYGVEYIEFIKVNADGSTESDGEFYWYDENKSGIIDEEDYFRVYDDSYREINKEQYIQYKEEQLAKQTETELEWTDKRLKDFATWQEAYIDFMNKPKSTIMTTTSDYSLIYVDDDDIPELYIDTGVMISGVFLVSFYDGKVRAINRERGGIQYMEYGGLFYSDWGHRGFYPCNVYMLEKGEFSEIGTGWIREDNDVENEYYGFDYFWEGSLMTEEEYKECLNKLIDTSKCIEPGEHTNSEILEIEGDN